MTPEAQRTIETQNQNVEQMSLSEQYENILQDLKDIRKENLLNADIVSAISNLEKYRSVIQSENPDTIRWIEHAIKKWKEALAKAKSKFDNSESSEDSELASKAPNPEVAEAQQAIVSNSDTSWNQPDAFKVHRAYNDLASRGNDIEQRIDEALNQ